MATVSMVMNAVLKGYGKPFAPQYVRGVLHLVDLLVNKLINLIEVFFFFSPKAIIANFGHCWRGEHKLKGYTVNMGIQKFSST